MWLCLALVFPAELLQAKAVAATKDAELVSMKRMLSQERARVDAASRAAQAAQAKERDTASKVACPVWLPLMALPVCVSVVCLSCSCVRL